MNKNNHGSTLVEVIVLLLFVTVFCGLILAPTVYGLILAFKASLVLGAIVFIIEPLPFLIGLIAFFGHPSICTQLAQWLHLPF